jgi:hypothetical protein
MARPAAAKLLRARWRCRSRASLSLFWRSTRKDAPARTPEKRAPTAMKAMTSLQRSLVLATGRCASTLFESISNASYRVDELRASGVSFDLAAQPLDRHIDHP